jgi:hypothetical protein
VTDPVGLLLALQGFTLALRLLARPDGAGMARF